MKLDEVLSAKGKPFDELLKISGLNPSTDLRFSDLRNVNFGGSALVGWDLTGADLTGASFKNAKLIGCILSNTVGANLSGAEVVDRRRRRRDVGTSVRPTSAKAVFDKEAILRSHPLFGQLGAETISRLASYSHIKSVAAGTRIFERGDPGTSLFAVVTGRVQISNQSTDGKVAVLNLVSAGGIFGEVSLLDGQPRRADALAATDCELMMIDRRDFVPLVTQNPGISLKLIEILCAQLRQTGEQVEDLLFLDLPGRLAKTLLWLARYPNSDQDRRVSVTQREIAQIIGVSRESMNMQLRAWEEKKWVRLDRSGVAILDPNSLAKVAGASELNQITGKAVDENRGRKAAAPNLRRLAERPSESG